MKAWMRYGWILDLVTEIPEYGISVSWESEDYSVIDMQGKLYQEGADGGRNTC